MTLDQNVALLIGLLQNTELGVCKQHLMYTGCPDQIVRSVDLILLPNQKTCRKCKDSFGIVRTRATKHALG